MTYCVGLLLNEGLVFASDTRTNAGVDQVAIVPKMHIFEVKNKRVIVILTAGNLAITQSVVNALKANTLKKGKTKHIINVSSMFDVAALVGEEMRLAYERDAKHLKSQNIEFNATILVGGQIKGEKPRLFNVYAAGNFIETCPETPYFQIGETKYGKPIIDRVVKHDSKMMDVVKCLLVSFDSTIRSNISVAAPIDLLLYKINSFSSKNKKRISDNDPYFIQLRQEWSAGLKKVFTGLKNPNWF